ncbi:membrane alanyl aminopeptidase-like [Chelonus insularis]|uniref:membrane alanyl aminopeptidase-like n=1 Tax=Chelonus insularis TaxID=460826 RepID=UPI00158B5516|nr:membrane alanyl aminopeptidase-like [Chelonus insularis]
MLVGEAVDEYDNGKYVIKFQKIIPANASVNVKIYFKELPLLALYDLFQFNVLTVTNQNTIDSRKTSEGISISTYLLAAFFSGLEFTKLMEFTSESYLFKYNTKTLQELKQVLNKEREQEFTANLLYEWSLMYLNLIKLNMDTSEWIIDGLATYLKYYGISKYEPISKIHRRFIEDHLQPALAADALESLHPLIVTPGNLIPADIPQDSKKIFNSKMTSLFRMLSLTFGLPVLNHAIQKFYEKGKKRGVTLNDLCDYLQNEVFFLEDIDLRFSTRKLIAAWTEQAGYPLLTVNVKSDGVYLKQSKFCWQDTDIIDESSDYLWWIPITWITKKTLNLKSIAPVYWLNSTQDKIMIPNEVKDDWIIFNSGKTGYYRVNYDRNSWKRIMNTLNSQSFNDIPTIDRMAIIDDVISLAKTGHVPIDIYLQGLEYIQVEIFSGPLRIGLQEFINLHEYYSDSINAEDIDKFIFYQLKWAYNSMGQTIQSESYNYCSSFNKNLKRYNRVDLDELSSLSAVERQPSDLFLFCTKAVWSQEDCQHEQLLFLDLISSFSQKLITPTTNFDYIKKLTDIASVGCSQISEFLSIVQKNKDFENTFYLTKYDSIVEWVKKKNNEVNTFGFYKYLLPNNILPQKYIIELTPHLIPGNFYFEGKVQIIGHVSQKTSEILLHFHNLNYHSINLEVDGRAAVIYHIIHHEQYQFLEIQTSDTLRVPSEIKIEIHYRGSIGQEKRGFYHDFYINNDNQIKWFAATNLERASARRLFPCFDEPFFKSVFQLRINRTADFKTVSNVKLQSVIENNGRYIDVFEDTPEISTHQIAFIVSEFNSSDEVSKNFDWFKLNKSFEIIYPIIQTKNFFDSIEKLVNSQEPNNYTYHDNLAQVKNQIENYGLIAYYGKNVITNPNDVSLYDKITYIIDWNYEMMYRFFRNFLTMDFWRCEWFTRAISYHFLSVGYENDKSAEDEGSALFIVHHLQPSMLIDASLSNDIFIKEDYTAEQIENAYNKFTDDKGVSILRMIEDTSDYLDTTRFFQKFVSNAVNEKKLPLFYNPQWGNCPGLNQFCKIVETRPSLNTQYSGYSNCILKNWISQKGFPVVHVKIENNTVNLSQTPFRNNPSEINSRYIWNIPITWTSSANKDFSATKRFFFLKTQEDSFQMDETNQIDQNGWVIFNLQQIGYYRVNYDLKMWNQIRKTLLSPSYTDIHQNNRAAIIDDLFNLAKGGYVDYATALSMTEYLIQEKNYAPWKAALTNFEFLDRRLVANVQTHRYFKMYVKNIIKLAYVKLGFDEENDEGYSKSLLRINILEWACKYKDISCITKCKTLFKTWMDNSNNLIPVNIRSIVYCTAINNGNEIEWMHLYNKHSVTNSRSEKDRIIKALACTEKPEFLRKLLLYSIAENSKLQIQESLNIFSAVYSSSVRGVKITMSFMIQHYNTILNYFRDYNVIKSILIGLVVHVTTTDLIEEFEKFVQKLDKELIPIKETNNCLEP